MKKLFASLIFIFAASVMSAQTLDISFTTSDYNGFGVSCFTARDGWITVTATGGTPPYTYSWSNGEGNDTISNLSTSYYAVVVTDDAGAVIEGGLNLSAPELLSVELTSPLYPNDFNVSCWHCFNGSISTTVNGGVTPYTYVWDDAPTTQNRTSVGGGILYKVTVTDANGCTAVQDITLTEPERSDWTMTGNTGSNPATHYIGTADNVDLVFKTNSVEGMRLKANGNLQISNAIVSPSGYMFNSAIGITFNEGIGISPDIMSFGDLPPISNVVPCVQQEIGAAYQFDGWIQSWAAGNTQYPLVNSAITLGSAPWSGDGVIEVDGTDNNGGTNNGLLINYFCGRNTYINTHAELSNHGGAIFMGEKVSMMKSLQIGYNPSTFNTAVGLNIFDPSGNSLMIVKHDGKIGIGTTNPGHKLDVAGIIRSEEVRVCLAGCDFVFAEDYKLMSLKELEMFIKLNQRLPGFASAKEMETSDGVALGQMNSSLLQNVEEIYLHLITLNKKVEELANENYELKKQIELLKNNSEK